MKQTYATFPHRHSRSLQTVVGALHGYSQQPSADQVHRHFPLRFPSDLRKHITIDTHKTFTMPPCKCTLRRPEEPWSQVSSARYEFDQASKLKLYYSGPGSPPTSKRKRKKRQVGVHSIQSATNMAIPCTSSQMDQTLFLRSSNRSTSAASRKLISKILSKFLCQLCSANAGLEVLKPLLLRGRDTAPTVPIQRLNISLEVLSFHSACR
jgi:hypothetical protein